MNLTEFVDHCRLKEIYQGFVPQQPPDMQGWGSNHPVFGRVIRDLKPLSIIEVGTWKGGSAIHMGKLTAKLGLPAVILCIDTWLAGDRAYVDHTFIEDTLPRGGQLRLLQIFMTNVLHEGLSDRIFPMPSTSLDAADSLAFMKVRADLIYIDADHGEAQCAADIAAYWPVLRPGGVMIGDDYNTEAWPGVVKAANDFAASNGLAIEDARFKFVLRKPAQ